MKVGRRGRERSAAADARRWQDLAPVLTFPKYMLYYHVNSLDKVQSHPKPPRVPSALLAGTGKRCRKPHQPPRCMRLLPQSTYIRKI